MYKSEKWEKHIKCTCGYNNKENNVKIWGTCRGCGKILDDRAYFKYQMNKKLRLWRGRLTYGIYN